MNLYKDKYLAYSQGFCCFDKVVVIDSVHKIHNFARVFGQDFSTNHDSLDLEQVFKSNQRAVAYCQGIFTAVELLGYPAMLFIIVVNRCLSWIRLLVALFL